MIPETDNSFRKIPKSWSEGMNIADNPFYRWNQFFSPEKCDEIIKLGESFKAERGMVAGNVREDKIRPNVTVQWVKYTEDTAWIYDTIWEAVATIQEEGWNFDIRGIFEEMQYTTYDASKGDTFYGRHQDVGSAHNHRKISITLQLTDESEYEGGELLIDGQETDLRELKPLEQKGSMIMFPSFRVHRVTPVTKGTRKVLVVWVSGPKLK
jgi:PKHD-type hydroxylase